MKTLHVVIYFGTGCDGRDFRETNRKYFTTRAKAVKYITGLAGEVVKEAKDRWTHHEQGYTGYIYLEKAKVAA